MRWRKAGAHSTARDALAVGAASYVEFILTNPNLYRLMKGPEFTDRERYPELYRAAAAPAATLVKLVAQTLNEHHIQEPSAEQGAEMLWGLAHGIGTLALDGQLRLDAAPSLARSGAAAMIEGWLTARRRSNREN